MEQLLQLGADVNATGEDSLGPLCVAIRQGKLEIAIMLIEYGASQNSNGECGQNPLKVALEEMLQNQLAA